MILSRHYLSGNNNMALWRITYGARIGIILT